MSHIRLYPQIHILALMNTCRKAKDPQLVNSWEVAYSEKFVLGPGRRIFRSESKKDGKMWLALIAKRFSPGNVERVH